MLKKDLAIEYVLNEIEYQAWEKLDGEEMDCQKLATFSSEDGNYVVIRNYCDDKLYKAPFTYDRETKEVNFGELSEVEEVYIEKQLERDINDVTVKEVKKGLKPLEKLVLYKELYDEYPEITVKRKESYLEGDIVSKNLERRLITGPVLIPDEPDHDGDVISKEKIEEVAHEWMLKYRNTDLQHTLNNVAYPVESFISKEEKVMENINGEEVTIPAGSWMLTSKVQDDDTWEAVKSGELRGYSIMGVPKSAVVKGQDVAMKRTTLADIENSGYDWVVPAVSLVDEPAVPKGIYTAVKSKDETVEKEDTIFERFKNFLKSSKNSEDCENKEEDKSNKSNERGDLEMDREEIKEVIKEILQEELEADKSEEKEEEVVEKENEDVEVEETEEVEKEKEEEETEDVEKEKEEDKEEVEKEKEDENTEVEKEKEEEENEVEKELDKLRETVKELKEERESLKEDNEEFKETLKAIKEKFSTNKSNQPNGQDTEETDKSEKAKTEEDERDLWGRKRK